jgi:hypothetical protein
MNDKIYEEGLLFPVVFCYNIGDSVWIWHFADKEEGMGVIK